MYNTVVIICMVFLYCLYTGVGTAAAVTITRDLSEVFSFENNRKYRLQIETRPQV